MLLLDDPRVSSGSSSATVDSLLQELHAATALLQLTLLDLLVQIISSAQDHERSIPASTHYDTGETYTDVSRYLTA